jgi:hypothetical protein
MKYLLLIYGNDDKWTALPAEELAAGIAKQDAWNAKYKATGELLGAYGLGSDSDARLVRRQGGAPVVTDGPYLESKEYIGSFYLIDVASEERGREIAAEMPWTDQNPVEMWPITHEAP